MAQLNRTPAGLVAHSDDALPHRICEVDGCPPPAAGSTAFVYGYFFFFASLHLPVLALAIVVAWIDFAWLQVARAPTQYSWWGTGGEYT